jgi:Ca-activated chloride channel family protein
MFRTLLTLVFAVLVAGLLLTSRAPRGTPPQQSWLNPSTTGAVAPDSSFLLKGPLWGEVSLTQGWLPAGGSKKIHLVAELAGRDFVGVPHGPLLNLVLVLDRSGSMRAERKMKKALGAAAELISSLRSEDVLGLVTYSTDAEVVLPCQPVGDGETAREILGRIRPGGATNISEALELALREAARFSGPERVTRILLLSDGKANVGVTEGRELGELAGRIRSQGMSVTCLGLGLTYEELTLQEVARLGGGNYHFLEGAEEASEVFQRELEGLQRLVAREVRLTVTPEPGVSLQGLGGYASKELSGGVLRVDLGGIAVGEERKAVISVSLTGNGREELGRVARVSLSYQSLQDGRWQEKLHSESWMLEVGFTSDSGKIQSSRNLSAQARVEELQVSDVLDQAVNALQAGTGDGVVRQLRSFTEASQRKNRNFYQDPVLERRLGQVDQLVQELSISGNAGQGAWVKRSRAQAYSLRR